MQKKLTAILITSVLSINLIIPAVVRGEDRLTEMFQEFGFYVNNTEPGAYDAQTQGFISGGSLSVRARYKELRMGSVTPPSISAGCGGVDMYFGGINFINKDELVNMLKALGQNTLGYAFELGLEAVCPTCNSVLKWLQDKASQLNKMRTDSCTASKYLVNNFLPVDKMAESAVNRCTERLQELGLANDPDQARKMCVTDNAMLGRVYDEARQKAQNNEKSDNALPGNATLQALRHLSVEERAFALNLLGTFVLSGPGDNGSTPELKYVSPAIGFKDIMYGRPDAKVYYPKEVENPDFNGLMNAEIGALGDPVPYTAIGNAVVVNYFEGYLNAGGFLETVKENMDNIYTKLAAKSPLTDQEKQYVNATGMPVLSLLEAARHTPGMINNTIDIVSALVAAYMVDELIAGYAREVKTNACNQSQVDCQEFITRIDVTRSEVHQDLMKHVAEFESIFRSYELADFFMKQLHSRVGDKLSKAITAAGGSN